MTTSQRRARGWTAIVGFVTTGAVTAAATVMGLYACSSTKLAPILDDGGDAKADGAGSEGADTFPEGFVFGTATAGFQVEMGCPTLAAEDCNDTHSDWYAFATDPRTVSKPSLFLTGQRPEDVGPGFWETYEQDLDRATKELHTGALRIGIEWSRLFPTKTDAADGYEAMKAIANPKAIVGYHSILAAAKARGLHPLVTVNHYSLPTWIHDAVGCNADLDACTEKGWLDEARMAKEIGKYAAFLGKEFGKDVDQWATLNEPIAVVIPGYVIPGAARSNPPGLALKATQARQVLFSMVEGHARIYDALKANDTEDADGDGTNSQIGVVVNIFKSMPNDPSRALDVAAAANVDYLWNYAFLEAVTLGKVDAALDGTVVEKDSLKGRMDYLGINYYGRVVVTGQQEPLLPDFSPKSTFTPSGFVTEAVYPAGFHDVVTDVWNKFKKPIYVTENGAELKDGDDGSSVESYLALHLGYLRKAVREGVDVRGYYYWSLMDNFEWNHGVDLRFGLYAVDTKSKTKERTLRPGGAVFARIVQARGVPAALAQRYPTP